MTREREPAPSKERMREIAQQHLGEWADTDGRELEDHVVDAINAALAESGAREEWQPIETAPKGGKWILLWWPAITDAPFVGYRDRDKWCAAVDGSFWIGCDPPTHWQPLPAAPQAGK